jgi:hypothetical protein
MPAEDEHWPAKLGFLGITGGFILKNPILETLTGLGLRAVIGVLGVLFQLSGNFLN